MRRSTLSGLFGFFALLLALTADLSAAYQEPPFKLETGWLPEHETFLIWYAKQKGWDKQEGLDIVLNRFDSGKDLIGNADKWVIGACGAFPILTSHYPEQFTIIGVGNDESLANAVMVRPDSPLLDTKGANKGYPNLYGKADDVRGKTIICPASSSAQYLLTKWLAAYGLTTEDVRIQNTDAVPGLQAFFEGEGDAIVLWAKRHADEARKVAEKTDDPVRKAELLRMAANAERVPGEPARDFWEACQSQWFVQMFSRIEQKTGTTISNGRMDQYLYPYYQQDIENGSLDNKKAIELLECMWVGMAEFIDMYISPCGGAFNEGYAHWEAVTVGGQTPDGRDATNELTHLILKSKREFPLHYPDLAARIHSRSPESYLWDVAETIKDGSGFPKLINDEEVVPLYVAKGATFEEALDYAVSGCTEARMPNRDTFTSGGAYINFAAAVEMVLRNGRMKKYGDIVLGEETGDPRNFKTWDEFWNAYVKQHMLFLRTAFTQQYIVNNLRAQHFAQPMGSAMHDLCMKHCIDLHQTHIPEGVDFGYFEYMGLGTVVDSLSAIKKLVFEDKKLTMDEVIKAIDANFEGYEDVKALLKSAPCYGNNDPYADSIGHEIDRLSVEFAAKYSQKDLGMHYNVRYVPFTSHVPFGKVVSATPNGRVDWFPLSDGSSASHGADVNGPTAVLLSNYNTKNMGMRDRFARMLNIKFTPKCVEGEQGTEKLVSFIRTFCDLKLWHVQFNVVNKSTLLAAQKDPQKYRNLIVRIAGYSAYFVDLSPDLQNDLIARTEHDTI